MPKRERLENKQFNDWTVLKYVGHSKYLCRCKCGKEREIIGTLLKQGKAKRCRDCDNKLRVEDLSGKQFGELKAISYAGDMHWNCLCSCGNKEVVRTYELKNLIITKCKQCRDREKFNKHTGETYNNWEVLEKDFQGDSNLVKCRCRKCGNIYIRELSNLRNGFTTMCQYCADKEKLEDISGKRFNDWEVLKYVGNRNYLCRCKCGTEKIVSGYSVKTGRSTCCGCRSGHSLAEEEIYRYIKEKRPDLKVIKGDRAVIAPYELDIYIPELKLAIEFNGDYWHSTEYKQKKYHQDKSINAYKHNIRLIHIFEYEWKTPELKDKILKLIDRLIEKDGIKMYARKLSIKAVGQQEEKDFLNKYHLQGYATSTVCYGLYTKENELIGLMSFGSSRFDNNVKWELIRLAWKNNISVIGGAERIFKAFLDRFKPSEVISYCNLAKFSGAVYARLGFEIAKDGITEPNYVWSNAQSSNFKYFKRYQTQKKSLVAKGLGTEEQTEDNIMESLGYFKIYDSGNLKFIYKAQKGD